MYVNLSLDNVSYKKKPSKAEIPKINNKIANSPVHMELSKVADLIGNRGHTFSGAIFSSKKRRSENFVSTQLLGLDFDNGISYKEIEQMADYYNLPICFAYHSFSSSPEKERFRVVFLHDMEITNFDVAKIIIDMLMQIFPACDNACSDVVRFYYGGKGLITKCQEKPIKLTDVADAFYRSLKEKENPHYTRTLENFAKKHNIALDGKCLKIWEYPENGNFLPTTDNIYTELGNFLPNSDGGNGVEDHPRYLIEKYQEKNDTSPSHPSKNPSQAGKKRAGRFAEIKYACRYCRLYREFDEGIDIGHDGRFHIMLSLMHTREGRKEFLDIIERTGNDLKKWKGTLSLECYRSYEHERSCDRCPYHLECNHDGTLIRTVRKRAKEDNLKKEVCILRQPEKYISRDEGRKRLHCNVEQAIDSLYPLTLIKAQTGIGKTYTYCKIISEQYQRRKFLVALPNNNMKNEVGTILKRKFRVPPDNIVITPSHAEPGFPTELYDPIEREYSRGVYDKAARIIRAYLEEKGDRLPTKDQKYLENFLEFKEKMKEKETRVILTTHTRLSTLKDDFLKDFIVIVDEDILVSSFFMHTREITLGTVEAVAEYEGCPGSMKNFLKQIVDAEDNEIHTVDNFMYYDEYFTADQMDEIGLHENINDLFRAATYKKENGMIYYYYPGKLPKTKCIVLSATLDVEIYKKYFRLRDSDVKYIEEPLVGYTGRLIQYTAHPLGRSTLTEECMDEIMPLAWDILGHGHEQDTKVITFMKYQNFIKERPYIAHDLYFSKCLGSNALEGKNVVVMGTPFVIDRSYKLIGAYLGQINAKEEQKVRRITYRDLEFSHMTYSDPVLQNLQCYWLTGELEQAVGRARLLSHDKTVIVFASVPCEQAEYICKEYLTKKR